MPDLWSLIPPLILAGLIAFATAWAVRRYAGPAFAANQAAQKEYREALDARMRILQAERDDLAREVGEIEKDVAALRVRVTDLQEKVGDLERQIRDLTDENLRLRRRLDGGTP